jgi:hypothetical protein
MRAAPRSTPIHRSAAVLLAALAIAPAPVAAFSSGSGTCVASGQTAAPMGMPSSGNGGYALQLQGPAGVPANRYIPGQPATLTVTGTTAFRGLLLYAEDAQGARVGGFTSFNLLNYRLLAECGGADDSTLTHQSALTKAPPQDVTWRAPDTDVGALTFRAIVLRGFNDYFVLQSAPVTAFPDAVFGNGFEP